MDPLAHPAVLRQFEHFARVQGLPLPLALPLQPVAARQVVDLLQQSAEASGRRDLGAAFAAACDLDGFGPLSALLAHCGSVADAVGLGMRHGARENGAVATTLEPAGPAMALRMMLAVPSSAGGTQFVEGVLLLALRIMRRLLGEGWQPLRVELDHAPPPRSAALRALFRCPLEFRAARAAIVLTPEDLARRVRPVDPLALARLERQLARVPDDLAAQVRQALAFGLADGRTRLADVAAALRHSPRTLQRRLAEQGLSLGALLAEVRRRSTHEYLMGEPQPRLDALAQRLGYAEASAASRFLRRAGGGLSVRRRGALVAFDDAGWRPMRDAAGLSTASLIP